MKREATVMRLPSTVTVCVDHPEPVRWRLLGMSAPAATAVCMGSALTLSSAAMLLGANEWTTAALNLLALVVPPLVLVRGTSRTLSIVRASRRWEREFLAGFRLALGPDARVEGLSDVLLSLQQGTPCAALVCKGDAREEYTAVPGLKEVVLLRSDAIDSEWAEMNATLEQGS